MTTQNHYLNDKTMKYQAMAQAKRQHEYLNLPGKFKTRYPQEVVYPDMETGRMDELYSTDQGMLINFEEESDTITTKTIKKFAKYIIFICYRYSRNVYLAVLCHKKPKKKTECYKISPTVYLNIHYYYFPQEELWRKYENLINKIKHKKQLTGTEALDMAFISKFISKEHVEKVLKTLAKLFNESIIPDKSLKIDVAAILGAMIRKYIKNKHEQKRLLETINMKEYKNEMERILYEEFGDTLNQKDEEIKNITKTNKEYKQKIKQLGQLSDLNSPEAKKILSSLLML